jgi:hypothetical protein
MVNHELESRRATGIQALGDSPAQKTTGVLQPFQRFLGIIGPDASEVNFRQRQIRRHLHRGKINQGIQSRIFQGAQKLRQLPLYRMPDSATTIYALH